MLMRRSVRVLVKGVEPIPSLTKNFEIAHTGIYTNSFARYKQFTNSFGVGLLGLCRSSAMKLQQKTDCSPSQDEATIKLAARETKGCSS